MPNNYPYYRWYPEDWKAQTAMLSLLARGFWRELLDNMHLADRDYQVSGTVTEIGLSVGCLPDDARKCIDEIRDKDIADVTESSGVVTIICRRLQRECNARKSGAIRVQNYRNSRGCNANVTRQSRKSNATRARGTNNQYPLNINTPPSPPKGESGETILINFADRLYREYLTFGVGYQMTLTKAAIVQSVHKLEAEGIATEEAMQMLSNAVGQYGKMVATLPAERKDFKKNSLRFFEDELWRNVNALEKGKEEPGYGKSPDDELGVDL
ncbi:MAG: hypothetical protein AB7F40_11420 [Victivallaceae bacterium]